MHGCFHAYRAGKRCFKMPILVALGLLVGHPATSRAQEKATSLVAKAPSEARPLRDVTPRRVVATEKAPKPIGPYSQGVVAGGLLFLSGQVAIKPETNEFISGPIEVQTDQVLKNIMAVLKEAKLGPENVVKTTVYLVDLADFPAMNKVYGQYFGESPPARSTVGVEALPKSAKVEIEVIAAF